MIASIHLCEGREVLILMDSYEINKDTYAIMSINDGVSKVLEKDDEYFVNKGNKTDFRK